MLNFTACCICSADARTGHNRDNLLFSGQLLPERNGGLSGTPSIHARIPFVTGVFRGYGAEGLGEAAAHRAATALCEAGATAPDEAALDALLTPCCTETGEADAPVGCGAAAVSVTEDKLHLWSCGVCRAYLLRDRALFLLTPSAGEGAAPYALSGVPIGGDRMLLCTGELSSTLQSRELLELLFSSGSDAAALQALLQQARQRGAQDSVTAVLLHFA